MDSSDRFSDVCTSARLTRGVTEVVELSGSYMAWDGSQSPTFQENTLVESSGVKESKNNA